MQGKAPGVQRLAGEAVQPRRQQRRQGARPVHRVAQQPVPDTDGPVRYIEGPRDAASRFLESLIQRTDSLFGGDQLYDAPTGSYLQLGGGSTL